MNILTLFLLYVIYLILMVMVRLIFISLLLANLIIRGHLVRFLWGLWWRELGVWVFLFLEELCTIFILLVGLGIRGIEGDKINDFQMLLFLYFGPIVQYLQLISFTEMALNQQLKDTNTFST